MSRWIGRNARRLAWTSLRRLEYMRWNGHTGRMRTERNLLSLKGGMIHQRLGLCFLAAYGWCWVWTVWGFSWLIGGGLTGGLFVP